MTTGRKALLLLCHADVPKPLFEAKAGCKTTPFSWQMLLRLSGFLQLALPGRLRVPRSCRALCGGETNAHLGFLPCSRSIYCPGGRGLFVPSQVRAHPHVCTCPQPSASRRVAERRLGERSALWRHKSTGFWLRFMKTLEIPHSHALVSSLPFGNHPWPVPCSEPLQQRSAPRGLLGAAAWFWAARASLIQPLLAQRSCFPPQK